jgi:hypothetical protein
MRRSTLWRRAAFPAAVAGALVASTVVGASPAHAVDTLDWTISAESLTAAQVQEDGIFSDGDEAYVVVIGFRTTPGVPGSTVTGFGGNLQDINDIDRGETHAIPASMGGMTFPGVNRIGVFDLLQNRSPEIIGTVDIVVESDATPFSAIRDLGNQVAAGLRVALAQTIEPINLMDINDPNFANLFGERLRNAAGSVSQALVEQTDFVGLFLRSFADPDDPIGVKASAFVAVDESAAPFVDQILQGVPPEF